MNLDRILPLFAPMLRRALRNKQLARESQFAAAPPAAGRVVFLGDSITEWTDWADWFPNLATTNRGIGGQAIRDIHARLETAIIEPRAISLLVGTNDLHGLGASSDVDRIAEQMDRLVNRIRQMAPYATLLVNSVMPRSLHFRERLVRLNLHYRRIASSAGATYIDLWPALADEHGAIRRELTTDGLHLSIAGYRVWISELRPHLDAFSPAHLTRQRRNGVATIENMPSG